MQTITVDNFTGSLTRKATGKMNSGLAKYATSFGYDPFTKPTDLTWMEQPSIISTALSFPLTTAKVKFDGTTSVVAVYGYGPDQKLLKFNVNSTTNPNVDTSSVLATMTAASPNRGGSMQFYGNPEKIYIGHDNGIARINFNGSAGNPSVATTTSSVVTNIPRPSANFVGKLYFANGTNLIEIDSTETVTSYAKLNPGFPVGTFIRDLDVTPDGNYLQITVSRLNAPDMIGLQDLGPVTSSDSYKFYWNGTDESYTSYNTYNGYALNSNINFGGFNYTAGYDLGGSALYSNENKILSFPNLQSPNFEGMFSIGNMVGFISPEYLADVDQTQAALFMYGQYDDEVSPGLFRLLRQAHIPSSVLGVMPDVLFNPVCLPVSNLFYGPNAAGFTDNIVGAAKLYISSYGRTANTGRAYTYKFTTAPVGQASAIAGIWESQNEIFSKKAKPTELRFYTEPLVANNQFQVDLIGSSGSSVLGGSKIFTVHSSSIQTGTDYVWWNPQVGPGYSWGTRITNLGSKNWTGVKLEIDFVEAGK